MMQVNRPASGPLDPEGTIFFRRRSRNERGASAVEFALIAPVLLLLLTGIIEMSFLMKDYVSLSSAVRAGARVASASADAGPGSCEASSNPPPCTPAKAPGLAQAAADMMQRTGTAMPSDDIDWIMVYQAGSDGFPLGSGGTLNSCGPNCVKYTWDSDLGKFRYASGAWDSKSVNACVNDAGRHTVGVAMQASHQWLMGFAPTPLTMREKTIMQFEPLESERCKPGTPNAHG